jgi:signal peptidase I
VRFVTRVVAVGGDRVRFQHGRVVRNGVLERRRDIGKGENPAGCTYPRAIKVPADHVYVAGDNRGASDDSRFWGAVPEEQCSAATSAHSVRASLDPRAEML